MSDIVERLNKIKPREVCEHGSQRAKCPYCEVAELEAENERLRAALREIASIPTCPGAERERLIHVARAALEVRDE